MTNRLQSQIARLYRLPDDTAVPDADTLRLVGPDGRVRAMVLALSRPADWAALSAVWRGVQSDLELPAPAIAVNGVDAYELWFSLAAPVALADADAFLQGLRQRYLADVKPQRVQLRPSLADGATPPALTHATPLIPAPQGDAGNWSAFVASDLAAVFGDEPVLDLPPGADAQAELLCRLVSTQPDEFEAALAQLRPAATAGAPTVSAPRADVQSPPLTGPYQDPKQFLRDVMNDASVPLASRIEAAKALLGC
jgi:hypothetical protein